MRLARRSKVLRLRFSDGSTDVGLIDAALLRDDFVGNFLPFDAKRLSRILLTRAEPDSVGMSPIGGFIDPVGAADDCGLLLEMGPGRTFAAPLSPGHVSRGVGGESHADSARHAGGFPGRRARARWRSRSQTRRWFSAQITIERDGPWVFDVPRSMHHAVRQGMIG